MHKELLCVLLSVGGELWVTTPYHSFEHLRGNAILFLEDKTKAKHEALHKFKCTVQKRRQKKNKQSSTNCDGNKQNHFAHSERLFESSNV